MVGYHKFPSFRVSGFQGRTHVYFVSVRVSLGVSVRGCSQIMSCPEGGGGLGQKVIFHDEGGRGGYAKGNKHAEEGRGVR